MEKVSFFIEGKHIESRCYSDGEIDGWNKTFVLCPKEKISDYFKEDQDLKNKTGVYFLLNDLTKEVYVGQGKIYSRLKNHSNDKDKRWWEGKKCKAVFFYREKMATDELRYIEKASMDKIKQKKKWKLRSKQNPKDLDLTQRDKIILEETLKKMSLIMSIFGYNFLEKEVNVSIEKKLEPVINNLEKKDKNFELTVSCVGKNVKAIGKYSLKEKTLKVLKGSTAVISVNKSLIKIYLIKRKKLIKDGILKQGLGNSKYVFTQDYTFSNPSEPGSIVLGTQVSGPQKWKIIDGTTLKEALKNNFKGTKQSSLFKNDKDKKESYSNKIKTYKGLKPKSFIFNGNKHKINFWSDLIVVLCEDIYKEKKEEFKKVLKEPSLKGKKRFYFSRDKRELSKSGKKIKGSGIYIETCFDADHIIYLCKKILKLFKYKENSFKVETA